ncbi:MAG: hypothetical protein QM756_10795 [Polyangiaceae bacterium]
MQLWLLLWSSALGIVVLWVLSSLELSFEGRALGESDGTWAAAFGLVVFGVVLSGVAARRQPTRLELHLFGRKIAISERLRKAREPKKPRSPKPAPQGRKRWLRLSAAELVDLGLAELGHVQVQRLETELEYGLSDVALTGRIAAVLYALSGALPPQVRLVQTVHWDGAERWQVSANGKLTLWPGRVLFDVLWYMIRARARGAEPSSLPSSAEPGQAADRTSP